MSAINSRFGSPYFSQAISPVSDPTEQLRAIGEQQVRDSVETAEVKRKVTHGQGLKDAYAGAR